MSTSDTLNGRLDEIASGIADLQRSVGRLRRVRFTGLILLLLLGCGLGAVAVGGTFYRDYRAAKRAEAFLLRFRNAGLDVEFSMNRDGSRQVTISSDAGSFIGGTRTTDATGVVLKFREMAK